MSVFFDFGYFWFWVSLSVVVLAATVTWFKSRYFMGYVERYEWGRCERTASERRIAALLAAVFAIVPAGFLCFIGDQIAFKMVKEPTSWSRPIANLGDGAGVEGRFFLGSGSIDTSPVYMYYLEEPEGFKLYHADASQSYVTYTDGTPQMVVHFEKSTNTFWARNLGYRDDEEFLRTYEFQVPRGSVKQSFNLDAQ